MQKVNQPKPPEVPVELWRELCQAARGFHELAPWEWMYDSQNLGVNNEHGVRMHSVLGARREVFGIACYRGEWGINYLLHLLQGTFEPESPEAGWGQDAILIDFAPLKELDKPDKEMLKRIGYQPVKRRPTLYPCFRSHKPGYVPWFLNESEVRMALDSLNKVTAFSTLLLRNPKLFDDRQPLEKPFYPEHDEEPLTVRQLVWHRMLAGPMPTDAVVDPNSLNLSGLTDLPVRPGMIWELDSHYSMFRITDPVRPFWMRLALTVDQASGYVLAFHNGSPEDPLARLAAESLVKALQTAKCRPEMVEVASSNLEQSLRPLLERLQIKLRLVEDLPALEMAREELEGMAGRIPT